MSSPDQPNTSMDPHHPEVPGYRRAFYLVLVVTTLLLLIYFGATGSGQPTH